MPYTATTWTDGSTALNQTHLNNIETQYTEATSSLEQDLLTAFVLSGLAASKDGTIANQLDVTAGIAFLAQTDGTLRRRAPVSSTQTTATPSTTYYLFLNNDGTWTWGTTSTGPTNSLAVCQVTTDGSGNISTVTDKRALNTTLFSGMAGRYTLPTLASLTVYGSSSLDNAAITTDGSGNVTALGNVTFSGSPVIKSRQSGAATGITLASWSGSAAVTPFSVGGQFNSALSWVDNSGNFNGPAGGGIPATRNGTAGSVPIYTGTTSPSNPPTGSIWVKA